jgi:hypothetical protein
MNRPSHVGERQIQDGLAPKLAVPKRLNTDEDSYQAATWEEGPRCHIKILGRFDVIISLYTSRTVLVCMVTRRGGSLWAFNGRPLPLYAARFIRKKVFKRYAR